MGVVVSVLGVVIKHSAGNPREMALAAVSSQSSMTSSGLMRPLPSFLGGKLIELAVSALSIGVQSFPALIVATMRLQTDV